MDGLRLSILTESATRNVIVKWGLNNELDYKRGIEYLKQHYFIFNKGINISKEYSIEKVLPNTSQKMIALSNFITDNIKNLQDAIIQITDWDIGEEIIDLFYLVRKQINDNRTIDEAPFHLFTNNDHEAFREIIVLALFFQWSIIIASSDLFIEISHDGYINVKTDSTNTRDLFSEIFMYLKLDDVYFER